MNDQDDGDFLVFEGGDCKALDTPGKVGGYLVRFGSPDETDASELRDFFTPQTDYGLDLSAKSALYYHHDQDPVLRAQGKRRLAVAEMKMDDVGVWASAQLDMADRYEAKIYAMAKAGKLGWSSGTVRHLVERKSHANGAHEITRWPLGLDASLTPTPAEPRARAVALKSLSIGDLSPLGGEPFADHSARTLAVVREFSGRFRDYAAMKARDDRRVSLSRYDELKSLAEELTALVKEHAPASDPSVRERLKGELMRNRLFLESLQR